VVVAGGPKPLLFVQLAPHLQLFENETELKGKKMSFGACSQLCPCVLMCAMCARVPLCILADRILAVGLVQTRR